MYCDTDNNGKVSIMDMSQNEACALLFLLQNGERDCLFTSFYNYLSCELKNETENGFQKISSE